MQKPAYTTSDKVSQAKDSSTSQTEFITQNRAKLSGETWQAAIDYANNKIDQLKTLVRIFAEYRDTNHPFPGQSIELVQHELGHDPDLNGSIAGPFPTRRTPNFIAGTAMP